MRPIYHIAHDWAVRCFGKSHVLNRHVRSLRLLEEALELCQAVGVPINDVHTVVQGVYARPKGKWKQEMGGTLMTATIFAVANGEDPDDLFYDELRRVLDKPVEEFKNRNKQKIMGDL